MNNLERAKSEFNLLNEFPRAKSIGNGMYRVNPCPKCGHKDHFTLFAPSSSQNKNGYWTYFSFNGCCNGGSIIDYLIEFKGLDKKGAIEYLIGESKDIKTSNVKKQEVKGMETKKEYDFTLLANKLHENCILAGAEYFKSRGLNKTIKEYKLGYCEEGFNAAFNDYKEFYFNHDSNKAYKYYIPLFDKDNKVSYIIPRADDNMKYRDKVHCLKEVNRPFLNQRYIENGVNDKFIYICEGWADALSLEELGKKAISLNGLVTEKLIKLIMNNKENIKNKIFIIAFDNDKPGEKAAEKLNENLSNENIENFIFTLPNNYKDINELFVENPGALEYHINKFEVSIKAKLSKGLNLLNGIDLLESVLHDVEFNYLNGGLKNISTGFYELDKKIGGGLYNGLYVIGAGSSIGKTTFVQQIADNIAERGNKVLFYSLEMGKKEMISKTIVREMYLKDNNFNVGSRQLLNGDLNETEFNHISSSIGKTEKILKSIYYLEGSFSTTISDIVEKSKNFKALYGESPVIIVDYLQAIAPGKDRLSDKQNVDINISELKRLSRDLDTPVIAISSINRQNYLSYIDFAAFKESGSIEYGADVVMGLQLNAIHSIMQKKDSQLNEKREEYNLAKSKNPREIEVVILKNRYGAATGTHNYKYYPKFNYFEEIDNDLVEIKDRAENEIAASLFE
ncbi:MAG: DnaB-like helicase C-terminal domain-containing protein [Clostridium perfringens]|nr:DnaB-like helicase C-terminal domain-containing protein [Clostridium perfringens]